MTEPPVASQSARFHASLAKRHGRKRYLVAALLLFLALLIGAILGVGGTIIYFRIKRPRPPTPEQVGVSLTETMAEVLELNPEEADRLRETITGHMRKVADIRRQSWDDIRDQFDALQDEVVEQIGPERYEVWEKERDRRMGEKKNLRKRSYDPHHWRDRREMRHRGGGHMNGPGPAPRP